jgi:hypothetical protein
MLSDQGSPRGERSVGRYRKYKPRTERQCFQFRFTRITPMRVLCAGGP